MSAKTGDDVERVPADAFSVVTTSSNLQMMTDPTPEVIERAKRQLAESFEFIPDQDKDAYLKAMQRAPRLVELESNPEHQLAFTHYDPWKAALRLATYWKTRVEFFGEERAFLPLTLTGEGAMSREDIDVLSTGFLMLLPDDNKGRTVLFHDRSRLTNKRELLCSRKRLRCFFYMLSTVAESENNRRFGYVLLSVYTDKTRNQAIDSQLFEAICCLFVNEVFPVRNVEAHCVLMTQRVLVRSIVPIAVKVLTKLNFLDRIKFIVHNCLSREQILDDLTREHSFNAEGIPKSPLGGMFTVGCFRMWLEKQQRRDMSKVYSPFVSESSSTSVGSSTPVEEDVEKICKKREANAAISRRKRARRQTKVKAMQEEVERLRMENQKLQEQGNALETRFAEAHCIVKSHERPTKQQDAQESLETLAAAGTQSCVYDIVQPVPLLDRKHAPHGTRPHLQPAEIDEPYTTLLTNNNGSVANRTNVPPDASRDRELQQQLSGLFEWYDALSSEPVFDQGSDYGPSSLVLPHASSCPHGVVKDGALIGRRTVQTLIAPSSLNIPQHHNVSLVQQQLVDPFPPRNLQSDVLVLPSASSLLAMNPGLSFHGSVPIFGALPQQQNVDINRFLQSEVLAVPDPTPLPYSFADSAPTMMMASLQQQYGQQQHPGGKGLAAATTTATSAVVTCHPGEQSLLPSIPVGGGGGGGGGIVTEEEVETLRQQQQALMVNNNPHSCRRDHDEPATPSIMNTITTDQLVQDQHYHHHQEQQQEEQHFFRQLYEFLRY